MRKIMMLSLCLVMLSQAALAEGDSATKEQRKAAFKEKMQQRLKETDKNGDGNIDKAEFMAKAEERFAKMDADKSGAITPEEFKALREKFREHKQGNEVKTEPEAETKAEPKAP